MWALTVAQIRSWPKSFLWGWLACTSVSLVTFHCVPVYKSAFCPTIFWQKLMCCPVASNLSNWIFMEIRCVSVCVCLCVYVNMRMRVCTDAHTCLCVCVCVREKERVREYILLLYLKQRFSPLYFTQFVPAINLVKIYDYMRVLNLLWQIQSIYYE